MRKPLVLVVEDEPAIQHGLSIALKSRGYEMVAAFDGQEALDQLNHCTPDLILADIRMPNMNGLQMLLTLKSSEIHRDIPVVMISASPGDQTTALDSGAAFFLRKPFDHSALFEVIESCLAEFDDAVSINEVQGVHLHAKRTDTNQPVQNDPSKENDSMRPLEVLMIDDDVDFASVIEDSLTRQGHQVTVMHNWLSLLRRIKDHTPDLLLIDVETPTGNGVTAMEFLTLDPVVAGIRKAFVTGVSDIEIRQRCEALGSTYLHKSGNVVDKILTFVNEEADSRCVV